MERNGGINIFVARQTDSALFSAPPLPSHLSLRSICTTFEMLANAAVCNHPYTIPRLVFHNPKLGKGSLLSSLSFTRNFTVEALSLHSRNARNSAIASLGKVNNRRFVSAAFGDNDLGSTDSNIFPRIHIKDPYQRLGISHEASEEEIQAARKFLIKKYSHHKPSLNSIESAHDKIMMQAFYERKNPKIDYNKKIKEVSKSKFLKFITSRFETPPVKVMVKNAVAFIALVILTGLFPTEDGPTVQVAISLGLTIYFIYERLKNRLWAFLYGVGSFFGSWMVATFLMVSVIPPLFQGTRSLEISTSIVTYIFLWISSTYLK